MRRTLAVTCLALLCLLAAALPATAAPAKVKVGKVAVAQTAGGRTALLVPTVHPIEMAGRRVHLSVTLRRPDGSAIHTWSDRPLANAGPPRSPDRRQRFRFVHTIVVEPEWVAALRPPNRVTVTARARLDADRDGKPEAGSLDTAVRAVPDPQRETAVCGTPPKRRAKPGQRVVVALPVCDRGTRWAIAERPERGSARIRAGKLVFRSGAKFRGTAALTLAGSRSGAATSVTPVDALTPVVITVGTAKSPVVRVFGDSVTAGFGYFEKGEPMPLEDLLSCRPGATKYDDACSSNSKVRSNKAKEVEYSADYGLANNVSWAAPWAFAH